LSSFNLFKELIKVCSNSVCSNLKKDFQQNTFTFPQFNLSKFSTHQLRASTTDSSTTHQLTVVPQQQKVKMASVVRQNYHLETEASINKQVNMELHAHYVYLSMSLYFDRDDIALPGFSKYFKKASAEEAEHAEKFMKFQNSRGGRVVLKDIPRPENDEWGTPLDAMKKALELEKTVNQSIIDLHGLADSKADGNMTDFLEGFLEEQVEGIKAIGDLVSRIARAGPGLGEIVMDKEVGEL